MLLRLVMYANDNQAAAGFISGDRVADFERVGAACSDVKSACDCPACWESVLGIITCEACLDAAESYVQWFEELDAATQEDVSYPLGEVTLLAPIPAPGKVFCLAQNFPSHVGEMRKIVRAEVDRLSTGATPKVFMKPTPNTICGPDAPILISPNAQFIDYEGEVAVIIGSECKYVEPEQADQYVAGVTCMNDVSERDLKLWERTEVGEWDKFFDWLNGKWMDNFAPIGPCVVPAKCVDINDLNLTCSVNGEVRQRGNTSEMIHSIAQTISYISQMLTLQPGDIIAMGTPGGVGKAMDKRLVAGDEVSVEIEGVGVLRNPVVAETV